MILNPRPADIITLVAKAFDLSPEVLASRTRCNEIIVPRHLAMYLCHRYTDATIVTIGQCFNRKHPSVIGAVRKFENPGEDRLRAQAAILGNRLAKLGYEVLR